MVADSTASAGRGGRRRAGLCGIKVKTGAIHHGAPSKTLWRAANLGRSRLLGGQSRLKALVTCRPIVNRPFLRPSVDRGLSIVPHRGGVRRYTRFMGYFGVVALFALWLSGAAPASVPAGLKVLKDPKGACQITVPEAWNSSSEQAGWAVLRDATTAIAVVTSQTGQAFKPLPESLLKMLGIPKEKIFENSAKRVYYQDKIAASPSDTNAFSAIVPGKAGTCSSRVLFLPEVSEETARKIVLSVGPAAE